MCVLLAIIYTCDVAEIENKANNAAELIIMESRTRGSAAWLRLFLSIIFSCENTTNKLTTKTYQ